MSESYSAYVGERGDDEPESRESEPGCRIVTEEFSSSEPTPLAPLRAMTPETAAQKMACSGSPRCPPPLSPSPRSGPGPLLPLLLPPPPLLLFMRMQRRLMHDCFLTPCPPNLDLSMQLMHSPVHDHSTTRLVGGRTRDPGRGAGAVIKEADERASQSPQKRHAASHGAARVPQSVATHA